MVDDLIKIIHPKERMLRPPKGDPEVSEYFRVGASGLECIFKAVAGAKLAAVTSVLDLPCGHGRIGRYLRAAYPAAHITFCDIDREMIDFCAEVFTGDGVLSAPDLSTVKFLRKYDIIWVGSLFTHVDADKTRRWMKHLCDQLAPGGLLIATFHGVWTFEFNKKFQVCSDEEWNEIVAGYRSTGYGYAPYRSRGITDIGVSLSKPSSIVGIIEAIEGVRLAGFIERGFANFQDVAVVQRRDRLETMPGWDSLPDRIERR